jgi:LmbE family N-acetylglucosaminyl deacetylase
MNETWIPERALFIYAHPDDIEYTVAGTAARWAGHGCEVVYVVITNGGAGSHDDGMTPARLAQIRQQEQQAAADVVGARACIFLGYPDGLLQPTLELRKQLVRLIRIHRPNVVVCGDPRIYFSGDTYINHPDHRAAAVAALEAVFPAAEMNMLYPDLVQEGLIGHKVNYVYVSTRREPNHFEDITESIDLKIEALRQHASQLGDRDPGPRIREWAARHGDNGEFQYAEAFLRITLKEFKSDA